MDGNNIVLHWEPPRITNGPMSDYEILYTDDPSLPDDQWASVMAGSPQATTLTLKDLKEKTPYHLKIRGHNYNGPGIPSVQFPVTTWLGRKALCMLP